MERSISCIMLMLIINNIIITCAESIEVSKTTDTAIQTDHDIQMNCGGDIILGDFGEVIISVNSTIYKSNECIWRIIVPDDDYRISMQFTLFNIDNNNNNNNNNDYYSNNCKLNYVELRNGLSSESPLIEHYCAVLPPITYSIGRELYVKFANSEMNENTGFSAKLTKVPDSCLLNNYGCEHNCDSTWYGYKCSCDDGYTLISDGKHCKNTYETSGTINSQECINKDNTENYFCVWNMFAAPQHRVVLNFTSFNLEGEENDYYNCPKNNHVRVINKLYGHTFRVEGPFCGLQILPVMLSSKDVIEIEYHTNRNAKNSHFTAEYYTVRDECAFNNGGCAYGCRKTISSFECFTCDKIDNVRNYYYDEFEKGFLDN